MASDSALSGSPRSIASQGDSGNVNAWSGIPHFLFQAASKTGFLTNTLDLRDPNYSRRKLPWNLLAPLRLEGPGGYQYSRDALEHMWERVPEALRHGEFISHFQLFPPLHRARAAGARHSFYPDATLKQLVNENYIPGPVGRRTLADALDRERELYHAARFFVAMCRRTADAAVREYGLDPRKVFIVRPGANMREADVRAYLRARGESWRRERRPFTADRAARLGFVGRAFERKGLPRLVAAADILHRRGRAVKVSIIGNYPPDLETHPLVERVGFIDKARDPARFLDAVDNFALGCLPSYVEPLGISTLECLRLGVPVLGADVGGIPDCVPQGSGFLIEKMATPEQMADLIEFHVFDPDRYASMVDAAERNMGLVAWEGTVQNLIRVWKGGAPHYPESVVPQPTDESTPVE
jgi:glycosyltransferase involved in cell wall biosynthesis